MKRLNLLDLEFANDVLAGARGADAEAPKRLRAEVKREDAERFRKGRKI